MNRPTVALSMHPGLEPYALRPDHLATGQYPGDRPRSLLFALARLAMLEKADEVNAARAQP